MSFSSGAGHISTEELFRQHAGFVARFLACCGVPEEHIDDAVQEVFLVVHRNGGYRAGIAKPTSYLGNLALYAAGKHRRRARTEGRWRSDNEVEQLAGETANPAHAAQVRQDIKRLKLALDRLPDELRTTLLLVDAEGESCLSVAAAFGCPVGTVYWRVHEARKQLQSAIKTVDARRAKRPVASAPVAGLERRPLPSLGIVVFFFGKSSFKRSEAGRLLRHAHEQYSSNIRLDQMLARHQQLVQSGAELPSWAVSCVPHAVSWTGLIGMAPIAAGLAVGGAVVAVAVLLSDPTPPQPSSGPKQVTQSLATPAIIAADLSAPVNRTAPVQSLRKRPESRNDRSVEGRAQEIDPKATSATPKRGNASRIAWTKSSRATRLRSTAARELTSSPTTADRSAEDLFARGETVVPSVPSAASEQDSDSQESSSGESLPDPARDTEPQKDTTSAPNDGFVTEMRSVAAAERLLSSEPSRALAIAQKLQRRFPLGYFREERAYVEVVALFELERLQEGREKADKFLRVYPDGPYSHRVRKAVAKEANE